VTKFRPEDQRELALDVLKRLRGAGYQALWAGGCVRDQLLGRTPNDYDVATNAIPSQIRALFGRRRTLEIGAAFGVVAVIGPRHAGMVEVSTFRRDAQYSDGRHPDAVVFSTPEDDAQRRDFTINGLFYDPLANQVIDYVGGQDDLARGLVRAIGDPRARFAEDKLRIVRAVRIAAGFRFVLDRATQAAIEEMAETINVVSPERVAQEFRRMLVDPERAAALELLRQTRLLAALMPEVVPLLSAAASCRDDAEEGSSGVPESWRRTLDVLAALREPSFSLALAALVHGLSESAALSQAASVERASDAALVAAKKICDRLRLSNKERDHVSWLLANRGRLTGAAWRPWSTVQPLLIAAEAAELVAFHVALHVDAPPDVAAQAADDADFCRHKLALPPHELNPPPLLGGSDLVDHGLPRGVIYKWLLARVRYAQLDGEIRSRDEALALVDRLLREKRDRGGETAH
jgi:tRNA nucleotidyltransferase/poly(A) polymerase